MIYGPIQPHRRDPGLNQNVDLGIDNKTTARWSEGIGQPTQCTSLLGISQYRGTLGPWMDPEKIPENRTAQSRVCVSRQALSFFGGILVPGPGIAPGSCQ